MIQNIYQKYYTTKAKEFVELILYISDKNKKISEIELAIEKLINLGVKEISTELIKSICETNEMIIYIEKEGEIEKRSKEQLKDIASLLMSEMIGKSILTK